MATLPFLLAASLTTAMPTSALPEPAPRAVHPALWVVSDADTTIYLFGTFHALDGSTNWFKDEVKTAFDRSDELMLETLVPEYPPATNASLRVSGNARFAQQAVAPLPRPAIRPLVPQASFLASTKVVMAASHARGMTPAEGADAILRRTAESCGKPVGGLESFQFQMNMFTSLASPEAAPPPQDKKAMANISKALAELESAWSRGDVAAFTPMLDQMRADTPATYETMFVQRNAKWARWIANRLKQPGVVFVAVGAGHLTGPDSVQNQLAALGVKAGRIN